MAVLTEEALSQFQNAKRQEFYTAVVGVTFRDKAHIEAVEDGDFAVLSPELNNEYDKTAVAVVHNETGNTIGYIKRELNFDIWENIVKKGNLYVCRIERTGGTADKPNVGFNLRVIRMYNE